MSYGHVGNAVAQFALQRLGAEVWAVHTVQFSNHTGYGDWTGQVFSGDAIRDLVRGLAARGALARADAVLSGYLGDPDIGRAILEAVSQARIANPALLYCCDPVMGDTGRGLFVRAGIVPLLCGESVPAADILTPNRFELEQLTGISCDGDAAILRAIRTLQAAMRPQGPRIVLLTGAQTEQSPPATIELIAASPAQAYRLRTPALAIGPTGEPNGAGDLIAALFLFWTIRGGGLRSALERSAAAVWGVLETTARVRSRELSLICAQEELVRPSRNFAAELFF